MTMSDGWPMVGRFVAAGYPMGWFDVKLTVLVVPVVE